jgi:glutamate synthase (NADPH) small chain
MDLNKNFEEVEKGYIDKKDAIIEASRCLQCAKPLCIEGCPVRVNVKGFLNEIKEERFDNALLEIKKTNNLPGICGRVCPQEKQCEKACVLGEKAIKIGTLERFAADNGKAKISKSETVNKKIAIVGSGPSGLTCASDLAALGYKVTIFEALHKAGGVLTYGIPEFRLPKIIVNKEIEDIKALGVDIKLNQVVGKIITLSELEVNFDAIFIGNGAGLPNFMNIPGENLINVYSANEYLVRNNLMKAYKFPEYKTPIGDGKNITVIGGGNVAVDAARIAKRLGANVKIVYRRTRAEMPARLMEVEHALKEGIEILELVSPLEILENDGKKVSQINCEKMKLGEPDESGRRSPVPTGEKLIIDTDEVIIAIGQKPNPILKTDLESVGIKLNKWDSILVDDNSQSTNPKFFAGGDIVGGNATVIKAMGDGRNAAKRIHELLSK